MNPVTESGLSAVVDSRGRPLRDLRLSVIDQCNFRCTYCMPRDSFGPDYPFLNAEQRMSFDDMVRLARAFADLGVEKIRITGGEPLLRRGLESLIERLAVLRTASGHPMEVALTTNGSLLAERAKALRDAGLGRVTVSLDALHDAVFQRMSDTKIPVQRVLDGIATAHAVGLAPVKVNAVIERGVNEGQVLPLVRYFKGSGVALRFIEYMDVGGAEGWNTSKVVSAQVLRDVVERDFPLRPMSEGRGGGTSINYEHVDGGGLVGFIASVSQPFCGDCTRARVSSDGRLYTCLFAHDGLDLKPWLRSDDTRPLMAKLRAQWHRRGDRYSEIRGLPKQDGRRVYPVVRMSLVGG